MLIYVKNQIFQFFKLQIICDGHEDLCVLPTVSTLSLDKGSSLGHIIKKNFSYFLSEITDHVNNFSLIEERDDPVDDGRVDIGENNRGDDDVTVVKFDNKGKKNNVKNEIDLTNTNVKFGIKSNGDNIKSTSRA